MISFVYIPYRMQNKFVLFVVLIFQSWFANPSTSETSINKASWVLCVWENINRQQYFNIFQKELYLIHEMNQ